MDIKGFDERTPVYMSLITVSVALAMITTLWIGCIGFGLSAFTVQAIGRVNK